MFEDINLDKTKIRIDDVNAKHHAAHPFNHKMNHTKLMDYLNARLASGSSARDLRIARMALIDKAVSTWMSYSKTERERIRKRFESGKPLPVSVNLALTFIQCQDMLTYYMETFAPGRAMFYHTARPEEVNPATQLVRIMNAHAIHSGYYRELSLAIWSILKYNLGGLINDWEEETGLSPVMAGGAVELDEKIVWRGNRVKALDMYNTLWDPTCSEEKIHCDGEWFATVEMRSRFWVAREVEARRITNVSEAMKTDGVMTHYRHPPTQAVLTNGATGGVDSGDVNWVAALSPVGSSNAPEGNNEVVTIRVRLRPEEFGLVDKAQKTSRIEIWEFKILNGCRIVSAVRRTHAHKHLPIYMSTVNDDGLGKNQKSPAEHIDPLTVYASHKMNIDIRKGIKGVHGLIVYNKRMVDLSALAEDEVAARIPADPGNQGDLSKAIWSPPESKDTSMAMQEIDQLVNFMNQMYPAQAVPSQVASIDRAVNSQVTAVQQGTNRRHHHNAAWIDANLLVPVRFAMYFNILNFMTAGEEVNEYRGSSLQLNTEEMRGTDLPYIIGMGLRAIDRLMIADRLQQLIFALIQNPNSAARVDVLRMIDYWSSMLDIDIDFKSFEIQQAQPQAQGEGEAVAAGAPAQEGTGVEPMTNPQAVVNPLYAKGAV